MPSRRGVLYGACLATFALGCRRLAAAPAEDVSDWVSTDHARVRLIDAGSDAGQRLAGLQIQLDPSYLTYWRTPGEAGVAPTVGFDGSRNLKSATLLFPPPQRFDEGGAEAFGYKDEVVFPLSIVPVDPHLPVGLKLALSFAVCSALCLPAGATFHLDLAGKGDSPEAGLVRDARRLLPAPAVLGAPGPLSILAVETGPTRDRARVLARVPPGADSALFVEAPEPWYLQTGEGRTMPDGRTAFDLRVLDGAKVPGNVSVILTLAAGGRAIETTAQLDAAAPTP